VRTHQVITVSSVWQQEVQGRTEERGGCSSQVNVELVKAKAGLRESGGFTKGDVGESEGLEEVSEFEVNIGSVGAGLDEPDVGVSQRNWVTVEVVVQVRSDLCQGVQTGNGVRVLVSEGVGSVDANGVCWNVTDNEVVNSSSDVSVRGDCFVRYILEFEGSVQVNVQFWSIRRTVGVTETGVRFYKCWEDREDCEGNAEGQQSCCC